MKYWLVQVSAWGLVSMGRKRLHRVGRVCLSAVSRLGSRCPTLEPDCVAVPARQAGRPGAAGAPVAPTGPERVRRVSAAPACEVGVGGQTPAPQPLVRLHPRRTGHRDPANSHAVQRAPVPAPGEPRRCPVSQPAGLFLKSFGKVLHKSVPRPGGGDTSVCGCEMRCCSIE